jgi:uncharacterized protein (DUF1800 family)
MTPSTPSAQIAAALATHRFGLGEASMATARGDAVGWLHQQIGPADPQVGTGLVDTATALRTLVELQQSRRDVRAGAASGSEARRGAVQSLERRARDQGRDDLRARLVTAATTRRPFAERLALFWSNHFTVSMAKASVRGLVGPFEREAVRPHIAGPFETLLGAAVRHPALLRYLDNERSAGPHSRVVQRLQRRAQANGGAPPAVTGLNENLAREILELHTVGVAEHSYGQRDVTALAAVLTGWRVPLRDIRMAAAGDARTVSAFDPAWHEPGPKVVLGRRYPEGPQALDAVLHDLAMHPSTARFLATKLARHFVADDPPPGLVQQLEMAYLASGGQLSTVYATLLQARLAWVPQPAKLKTPEEFIVSSARLLELGADAFSRQPDGGAAAMGQRLQAAPSPAGWPDRADDWLGPDALWKRVEWATRLAEWTGRQRDARALAASSLGPLLSHHTRAQIERAADAQQALALLLLCPEFQRR